MVMVLYDNGHISTDLPDPNEDPAEIMKKLCRECGEPELAEKIEANKDKKDLVADWFDRHIDTFGQKKLADGRTIAEKVLDIRRKLENKK